MPNVKVRLYKEERFKVKTRQEGEIIERAKE